MVHSVVCADLSAEHYSWVARAMSFFDTWKEDLWHVVEEKYNTLLKERPAKQDQATGTHYGDKVYEILATKKESRNVACNLAWTGPVENTNLQRNISMATVERFALDMYVDTTAGHGQAAGSAATSAGEIVGADEGEGGGQRAAKVLLQSSKKAWRIPSRVPRGYEIQIAIVTTATEPPRGKFRRLGLDVVVNATWLAMKWALESGDRAAEAALSNLILDWPFDFILFDETEETTAEAQIMKHIINMPAATERLRDFCGLDQGNLMRIAAEVRKLIQSQTPGRVVPTPDDVHTWMINPNNIRWGLYHVPKVRAVKDLLRNWDSVSNIPDALTILDRAKCEFGRESLFESPTKLNNILEKAQQNPALIIYIMESLLTFMLRKQAKNPFTAGDLKEKGGAIDMLLWQRRYLVHMHQEYSKMFDEPAAKLVKTLREAVLSPLAMYELTQGDTRDVHFAQTLPNEPLRLFFKHAQDVLCGFYTAELKGALTTSNNFTWAKFHETDRVKKRFLEDFTAAYNALTFKLDVVPEAVAAVAASVAGEEKPPEPEPQKGKKSERLAEFRTAAEASVAAEIDARMVVLTQDGTHQELTARLSTTRLYQNLTESVRFMAFYDVKNARLMDRRPTETLVQREPLVDMSKFTAFCEVANGVLKHDRDFVWILAGRSDANADKIRKKVAEFGWRDKAVHLVYDWKKFQKWYVKKMRGMANSKSYEKAILCWKGKFPSGLPRDRQYVDAGSALYVDTMVKVPVLHPKDLTYVDASVLAESLKTMCGLSEPDEVLPEEPEEALPKVEPVADSAASMRLQEHVKKRRLYRTATDESVVWFPHDNHPDLLKELVWESGSPRWVLHGTPASGAGIIGCFDTGVSVIALCENAHHHKHLDNALRERAVEAMLAGSRIFKDEALQARMLEFCPKKEKKDEPAKETAKVEDKKDVEKEGDDGDSDSDSDKKEKKDKKKTKKKDTPKKGKNKDGARKRKRSPSDTDSSIDSSTASYP